MSRRQPVIIVDDEDDKPPPPLVIDANDIENNVRFVHELGARDSVHPTPMNIDVTGSTPIDLPLLEWHHYADQPKKMRLTNSGHTLILSAKWHGPRPFLTGGPLLGRYVFSQLHFHWGANGVEGSEHTVDENRQPLELHALHFKRDYLTHEAAKRQPDGIVCLCYLFQIRSAHSDALHPIVSALRDIRMASSTVQLQPGFPLTRFMYPFEYDYFMYWGRCAATPIMWLVCRHAESLSFEQLCLFRQLLDGSLRPIVRNWREVCCRAGRLLLHVNAATVYTNSTLAPVPLRLDPQRELLCPFVDAMTEQECGLRKAKWMMRAKEEGRTSVVG